MKDANVSLDDNEMDEVVNNALQREKNRLEKEIQEQESSAIKYEKMARTSQKLAEDMRTVLHKLKATIMERNKVMTGKIVRLVRNVRTNGEYEYAAGTRWIVTDVCHDGELCITQIDEKGNHMQGIIRNILPSDVELETPQP